VLLLREADKRLGLIDAITACLQDPRHPSLIKHSQREMLAQRVYTIALGYEDFGSTGLKVPHSHRKPRPHLLPVFSS
ncbi:MAG: transposase, partial [Candidatus Eisenbacteria bacterium]|nr:transposase [Candidatus Eisenbacteria bacterium]